MSSFTLIVLAFSMSIDAFAVSVGRGAAIGRPRFAEVLRTGAVFGLVEAITPVIGWAAGVAASGFIQAVDHWIAFGLLASVGVKTICGAVWKDEEAPPAGRSMHVLVATAIGTSLDAMAVGVSLAFLNVNIVIAAIAIGLATFLSSSTGMLLGRIVGGRFGRAAEIFAGVALVSLGISILVQHLSAG